MKIDTESGCVELVRAGADFVDALAACWPFGVQQCQDKTFCRLVMQADYREMWGVTFPSAVPVNKDFMPKFLQLKRIVLPAALNIVSQMFDGAMMAGLFCRGNNIGEHGLALFPALRLSRNDNLRIQPHSAAGRDEAFSIIRQHSEGKIIMEFLHVFNELMTQLLGQKEVYDFPSFLPAGMIGCDPDFMALKGKLVYIGVSPDACDPCWQMLSDFKINQVFHLPMKKAANNKDTAYQLNFEDFYVTSTAAINSYAGHPQIWVPELIGSIVVDQLSIGWDGCVSLQPVGIGQNLRIDPRQLRKLERQVTSEDKARNLDLWNRRAVIAQKELGWQGLILVKGQMVQYDEAVEELEKSTRSLNGEAKKNAAPAMLKGLKKVVMRSLASIIKSPATEKVTRAIDLLEKAISAEELVAVADFIFKTFNLEPVPVKNGKTPFPPSGGKVNFINDTSLRRPKLLLLYQIACKINHDRRYSRGEIETIVKCELASVEECRRNDFRFYPDVIIRNLVDVGYLDRDPHTSEYWLAVPLACVKQNDNETDGI